MDPYALGLKLSAAGQHARAIAAFEQALGTDPNDTRTLFALGNTARALGMKQAAEELFRRVLALEPERLEAIVNLANCLREAGRAAAAEAIIRPALASDPESPDLLLALAAVRAERGAAEEAIALYRAALEHRSDFVPALVNLADLLADRSEDDKAMALYDRALKIDPGNAQGRLNRALLYLARGNMDDGWREYAARLKVPGKVPVADHNVTRWNGAPLKRTHLLVTAEQGIGDQVMFASLIPELTARAQREGGRIILECEPRLRPLFARSFPGAATQDWVIETRDGVARTHYAWLKAMGGANAAIEMGSLPRYLRKAATSFPAPHAYLMPDIEEAACWRTAFANLPRPLIGVSWRSGSIGAGRAQQYAPLEAWGAFLRQLPGSAVCAQYGVTPDEIAALNAASGRPMVVPGDLDQRRELDRTTALFSVLDAMVTAPTAVSWMAAGLGLPTFKVQHEASWRSLGKAYEPFAPSARCLAPKIRGDWSGVFAQTLDEIRLLPG